MFSKTNISLFLLLALLTSVVEAQITGTWESYLTADTSYDNLPNAQSVLEYDTTQNRMVTLEHIILLDKDSVYKYNDKSVYTASHLSISPNGHIWLSDASVGIHEYNGAYFSHHKSWDTQNGGLIQAESDKNGKIWYGVAFGTGTFAYDGTNNTKKHAFDPDLIRKGQGQSIWFAGTGRNATNGELYKYDGATWTNIAVPYLVGEPYYIKDLVEEPDGTLWLAIQAIEYSRRNNGGLLKRTPAGTWTRFKDTDGLPASAALSIKMDTKGYLWIGTTNGLACLKNDVVVDSWKPADWGTDTSGTFTSGDVKDIAIDKDDNIWIGNRGVFKFSPSRITNTFDEQITDNTITVFPNPALNKVFISGIEKNQLCKFYNNLGKHVVDKNYVEDGIDISQLQNGIYLVKINNQFYKVVKSK